MLKYLSKCIIFREIPSEITLGISLSGCSLRCPDCNQKELWTDKGEILNRAAIKDMISENEGITCVCFLGNGNNEKGIRMLNHYAGFIHKLNLKTALYTGLERKKVNPKWILNFDYVKFGPYRKECGGLDSETTNQRFYKQENGRLFDYTPSFWNHYKQLKDKYFVSDDGKVWSIRHGKYLKQKINKYGYKLVKIICDDKKVRWVYVHHLVARMFIPNPQNLPNTRIVNGDLTDIRIENIEWCDFKNKMENEKQPSD